MANNCVLGLASNISCSVQKKCNVSNVYTSANNNEREWMMKRLAPKRSVCFLFAQLRFCFSFTPSLIHSQQNLYDTVCSQFQWIPFAFNPYSQNMVKWFILVFPMSCAQMRWRKICMFILANSESFNRCLTRSPLRRRVPQSISCANQNLDMQISRRNFCMSLRCCSKELVVDGHRPFVLCCLKSKGS